MVEDLERANALYCQHARFYTVLEVKSSIVHVKQAFYTYTTPSARCFSCYFAARVVLGFLVKSYCYLALVGSGHVPVLDVSPPSVRSTGLSA